MYKLLTGVITEELMAHVEEMGILPLEQKAIRRGRRGCLDALMFDEALVREARRDRRSLSVAWIDYRKAFDMVPHAWIDAMLKAIRAPKEVRRTVRGLIPKWRSSISLETVDGWRRVPIVFKRGIYQGESLSPLLFCLAGSPLSEALREGEGVGFRSKFHATPVTHQLYVDDLKLYAESKEMLERMVGVAEEISTAVGMEFGLKKCAVAHLKNGRVKAEGGVGLGAQARIEEVDQDSTYKYLGVAQLFGASLVVTKVSPGHLTINVHSLTQIFHRKE